MRPIPSSWWKQECRTHRFSEAMRLLTVSSPYAGMKWTQLSLSLSLPPPSPQTHLSYGIIRPSLSLVFSIVQSVSRVVASWGAPVRSVSAAPFTSLRTADLTLVQR